MNKLLYRDNTSQTDRPEAFNLLLNKDTPKPKWWLLGAVMVPVTAICLIYWFFPSKDNSPQYTNPVEGYHAIDPDVKMAQDMMRQQAEDNKIKAILDPTHVEKRVEVNLPPPPEGFFRVAAVQVYTEMGEVEKNRDILERSIRLAAKKGSKIIVLPEASVPGYADMETFTFWSSDPEADLAREMAGDGELNEYSNRFLDVATVAETADGPSFQHFAAVAKELGVYIVLPYIEKIGSGPSLKYYNAATLIDPQGNAALHYRKQHLWNLGDPYWAEPMVYETQPTAQTPYGKVGIMICYDMHKILPKLADAGVDIILQPAGFYGMNFEGFLVNTLQKRVKRKNVNLVIANWAYPWTPSWEGYGLSRIIRRDGKLIAAQPSEPGAFIVINDLPLPETELPSSKEPAEAPAPKNTTKKPPDAPASSE